MSDLEMGSIGSPSHVEPAEIEVVSGDQSPDDHLTGTFWWYIWSARASERSFGAVKAAVFLVTFPAGARWCSFGLQ